MEEKQERPIDTAFSKQDIYRVIEVCKQKPFADFSVEMSNEQPNLGTFLNGGMRGYLKIGQRNSINFLGGVIWFLFVDRFEQVGQVDKGQLERGIMLFSKAGISDLHNLQPELMAFITDALHADPLLPHEKVPVARAVLASVFMAFWTVSV